MAGRQVTIQFLGDARSFVSATGKAASATDSFSGKLKRVAKAAIIGFAGATVAAGKVMYEFAEAAVEDEKSAALLAKTLKNTTGATKNQIGAVEDWISKQGELYGVTDDDLRPALAKLAAATGDITKSQKLASLAMDVSAGTGKDLGSITLALAKAQNGSLAGLGRLGVATKDAAGKTKTLAEITDDLSKKYKGSAATAADTAAGKFQRVKVALSETGEAIGYKLLPYANDLGDWLVKEGIPKLEELSHEARQELGPALRDLGGFIKDNKDDFADLGKEVVQTVIPAIRDVGGYVADAVRFFSGLPDPVKRVGIEAGIAAAVIPKLSAALNGMASMAGLGTSKLAGWRKGLVLAAGVTGVGLMTEGAKKGNKAVSLFGDALTGAFVGGTLGSAIPIVGTAIGAAGGAAVGTAVGLFRMHKQADNAGSSAKDATPKFDELAAAISSIDDSSRRAVKGQILLKLQQDGVVDSAQQLGIATSDLIKASMGNDKAIARVNSAWEDQGDILDGLTNQKVSDWLYGLRRATMLSDQATRENNAALDGTDRKASKAGDALQRVGKQRPQTDKWTALYMGDLDHAVRNTGETTDDMRRLLSGNPGKARADMSRFGGDLAHQLAGIKGQAGTAGRGIGEALKQGVQGGLSGIAASAASAVHAAVAAAQAAVGSGGGGGGKGGGKKRGRTAAPSGKVVNLDDYRTLLGGLDPKKAEVAGTALLAGIVRGLKKGERTLKNVMEGLHNYIKTKSDKLAEALTEKGSFVDSFRSSFSESIFSAQNTDAEGNSIAPTLASMKAFAQQQKANAEQLAGNVRKLLGEGLSRDLIQQLIAQGSSGTQQIAALATGTAADVQEFNAINTSINSTLSGLGVDLYDALNPNAEAQINLLTQQVAEAQKQTTHLANIADKLGKGDKIEIKGTDLVILLRAVEKATGRRLLVASA